MNRRKMKLPDGWYPHNPENAEILIQSWDTDTSFNTQRNYTAAIVPHAGWFYSGQIAYRAFNTLIEKPDLIILAGGHLPSGGRNKVWRYDSVETPFGDIPIFTEGLEDLCCNFTDDTDADNTVEIQLPLLKYLFPDAVLLAVRLTPDERSFEWGRMCRKTINEKYKLKTLFIGSTDLTHYGQRFHFTIDGRAGEAHEAVRERDHALLEAFCTMDIEKSLALTNSYHCACSLGAALGAAGFAKESGISSGEIMDHKYSYELIDDASDFVGYGSVIL